MEDLRLRNEEPRIDPTEARAVLERLRSAQEDERPTVAEFAEAAGASVEEVEAALRAVRSTQTTVTSSRKRPRFVLWTAAALMLAVVVLNVPISSKRPFYVDTSTTRPLRADESFGGDGTRVEAEILYVAPTLWRRIVGADVQPAGPVSILTTDAQVANPADGSQVVQKDFYRIGFDRYHVVYEVHYTGWGSLAIPWKIDGRNFETRIYEDAWR